MTALEKCKLQPYTQAGDQLDATFALEEIDGQATLLLESRGGSTNAPPIRNADYHQAFTLLLQRLGQLNCMLEDIQLASKPVRQRPADQKRLHLSDYPYPIRPSKHKGEAEDLRLAIGNELSGTCNKPGTTKGNAARRVRLFLGSETKIDLNLAAHLVGQSIPNFNDPKHIELREGKLNDLAPKLRDSSRRTGAVKGNKKHWSEITVDDIAPASPFNLEDLSGKRTEVTSRVSSRRGQGKFRDTLLVVYQGRCAITGCPIEETLEAAHIIPHQDEITNHITNGILLRADVHSLFDSDLLGIHPATFEVLVASRLEGTEYEALAGKKITLPEDHRVRPSPEALHERWQGFPGTQTDNF